MLLPLFKNLEELILKLPNKTFIIADIPIGLDEKNIYENVTLKLRFLSDQEDIPFLLLHAKASLEST